jgi:hypothetical protein
MDAAMDLSGGLDRGREQVFAERPDDPLLREAVNMWIWDDGGRFGLPRVAVEALGSRWDDRAVQVNIGFPDGRVLLGTCAGPSHPAMGPDGLPTVFGAGPLAFACVEPFDRWTVHFRGPTRDTTVAAQVAGEVVERATVEVEFRATATMAVPPWYPGQFGPSGDAARKTSTRYEQLFRAEGTFRVGDDEIAFSGGGLRVRRRGTRDSTQLSGHCWLSAVFPSGRAFSCKALGAPSGGGTGVMDGGVERRSEAYVYDGGTMRAATPRVTPWMTVFEPFGGDVSLTLETELGLVSIEGENHVSTYVRRVSELNDLFGMPFLGGADRLAFHQGIARFRWDGEEAFGMIERSYPLTEMGPAVL